MYFTKLCLFAVAALFITSHAQAHTFVSSCVGPGVSVEIDNHDVATVRLASASGGVEQFSEHVSQTPPRTIGNSLMIFGRSFTLSLSRQTILRIPGANFTALVECR